MTDGPCEPPPARLHGYGRYVRPRLPQAAADAHVSTCDCFGNSPGKHSQQLRVKNVVFTSGKPDESQEPLCWNQKASRQDCDTPPTPEKHTLLAGIQEQGGSAGKYRQLLFRVTVARLVEQFICHSEGSRVRFPACTPNCSDELSSSWWVNS